MATADLTVIALGRPDASAGEYIAEIQRRLAAQDRVGYRMHAMGTSLEGSTEDILAALSRDYPGSLAVRLWNGDAWASGPAPAAFTLLLKHPGALRAML